MGNEPFRQNHGSNDYPNDFNQAPMNNKNNQYNQNMNTWQPPQTTKYNEYNRQQQGFRNNNVASNRNSRRGSVNPQNQNEYEPSPPQQQMHALQFQIDSVKMENNK